MTKTLGMAALLLWQAVAQAAPAVKECMQQELLGLVPSPKQVDAHRQGALPVVEYAKGEGPGQYWGFQATLRVDERGRIDCYRLTQDWGDEPLPLNPERRAWLARIATFTYEPFTRSGAASVAIVTESVRETERVDAGAVPAAVPLAQASVSLQRTACFGSCPIYTVKVRGDGAVTYTGTGYVDVEGEHHYTISAAEAARLMGRLYAPALWSAKDEYEGSVTDNPAQIVTIALGERTKSIRDYVGESVGMPPAISELEDAIDQAAETGRWIRLGAATVDLLDAEGFDFPGAAGSDLLWRAARNRDGSDDRALVKLLQLGVRADTGPPKDQEQVVDKSLLEVALESRHVGLAQALMAAGALQTARALDPAKVNGAFRASIAGGRLAGVEQVWAASPSAPPDFEFDDSGEQHDAPVKRAPVSLLLAEAYGDEHWEGLAIAQWLAARGCNLKASGADGRTLLHIAAAANDVAFVRYLLDQGLDPNARGPYNLPALGSAQDEDVAMLLLEAGTDPSPLSDANSNFRQYAEGNHWLRVVKWVDAHK